MNSHLTIEERLTAFFTGTARRKVPAGAFRFFLGFSRCCRLVSLKFLLPKTGKKVKIKGDSFSDLRPLR